ncbi:hypothetical protein [Microbispora sp. KK1-11]|uniref:hypothetical protein n=1 Tax=Microbispora sp. KK1-11 TaxID=2053005 RepID=UPI00163CF4DD|nr:hypothetical protein [Microbispora sp. KK1-11]
MVGSVVVSPTAAAASVAASAAAAVTAAASAAVAAAATTTVAAAASAAVAAAATATLFVGEGRVLSVVSGDRSQHRRERVVRCGALRSADYGRVRRAGYG